MQETLAFWLAGICARLAASLPEQPHVRADKLRLALFVPLAIWFVIAIILLAASPTTARADQKAVLSNEQLLAEADARIEKYRKADAVVEVLDNAGKPVRGATVHVEQARHAFLFGCNIFLWGRVGDEADEAAYRKQFADLLNYATLPFYWADYESIQGHPQHASREQVARWCQQQGIVTKGHPLAWNHADPRWLPSDPDEIRRLQMARIDDCVSHFAGLIDRWDVVNEVTHFDRDEFVKQRAPKMSAMWQRAGRMEFTRECFVHARQANPNAKLVINDYRTDPPYEKVIEQLVDPSGHRLYDVIGIQSHMHGGTWPAQKIWEICERLARFGVPLHFTETTIVSGKRPLDRTRGQRWLSTPEGEAFQAREVAQFYTMLFSHPAVEAITWWDFSDRRAWQGAPAGLIRADMTPKPAYQELLKLIKGKWWTETTLQTGPDGTAAFRGILGNYRITITADDRKTVLDNVSLKADAKNRWKGRL